MNHVQNPSLPDALKSLSECSQQAQAALQQALAELQKSGADSHTAFAHTAKALTWIAEMGIVQDARTHIRHVTATKQREVTHQ